MKTKHCFLSAALIGIAAGVVRILQHIWTIDPRGFYLGGRLSDFFAGCLVGLLAVGLLLGIFSGIRQKKEPATLYHFGKSTPTRLLFLILAAVSVSDGIFRLAGGISIPAVFCFLGGIAWLILALRGTFPPFMELLPLLQLGGLIVDYFRSTYKYIQISEYCLGLLGLSSMAYFALVLIKTLSEADCTKGRLITASSFLLVFGVTSFLTPLTDGFEWSKLLFAVHGFTYCLLAALTLIWLPEGKHSPSAPIETPNLDALNQYISDLPEVQEDEQDDL